MGQIMRLRRIAGSDEKLVDPNNGHRHEEAFSTLVREYGLLHEAELLPRSYGGDSWFGKFHPRAARELVSSLPAVVAGVMRGKVSPKLALLGHKIPKSDLKSVDRIYKKVEGEPKRVELNLYVSGYDDEPDASAAADAAAPAETEAPAGPEETTEASA
jgi:succinate dehydrogenase / fumarate reductase iron-sulfur subunit